MLGKRLSNLNLSDVALIPNKKVVFRRAEYQNFPEEDLEVPHGGCPITSQYILITKVVTDCSFFKLASCPNKCISHTATMILILLVDTVFNSELGGQSIAYLICLSVFCLIVSPTAIFRLLRSFLTYCF